MKLKQLAGMALLAATTLLGQNTLADVVQITDADLTAAGATINWSRTNTYVLNGYCFVKQGQTLNIEAGTIIKGKDGAPGVFGALFITRGAKIFANGTPQRPIIFTAEADNLGTANPYPNLTLYQRGLWGGIVLYGNSILNTPSDAGGAAASPKYDVFEGLPDTVINGQNVHRFGGNDDNDSSGVMRYVSIRHGGKILESNKELNGLSLCAVGRGTTIEFVEAYAIADDGFEFFGGTVNTRYLVSAFNDDDAFDADQGHRGQHQFWFGIQAPDARDKGFELNGEPNGIAVNASPIANFTVYNATMIGAGAGSGGANNNVFTIREYAAPRFYNCIFTDFAQRGISIDSKSLMYLTNGTLDFRENLWFGFTAGNTVTNLDVLNSAVLFTNAAFNNLIVDPLLTGISRTNNGGLDPRPQTGSLALLSSLSAPENGFLTTAAYKGAFDQNNLWIAGWTALSQLGVIPQRAPANVVQITDASLTAAGTTINWYRTNVYVLNGYCFVKAGQTLNIEAGTIIKGKDGAPGVFGALFITRGAKIFANGTPNNPIIFTAEADNLGTTGTWPNLGLTQRGLWGGVVLYGKATLNTPSDAGGAAASPKYDVFEGLADTVINGQFVHRFGGSDDNDNSGVMRYVSIRHGGKVLESNKELNGLSLCAVGRGTTLEFIEAYAIADDGFEFFGGTVNTRYLVSAFNDDDAFDADQGYRGRNQFWFGIQSPDVRDKGFELNGEPNGIAVNATPIANFEVYNATSIGAGVGSGGANNNAFTIREYAAPKFFNSIFTDYAQRGVSIDAKSGLHLTNGILKFENNLWFGFTAGNTATNLDLGGAALLFSDTTRSNLIVDPLLTGISRTSNGVLDPRPQAVSPARSLAKSFAADGFLTPVTYVGAFGDQNWAADWTALSAYGVLSTAGGATPPAATGGVVPPTLAQAVGVIGYAATKSVRELQGSALTLLATPAGSAPFTFQWYLNGVAVPNATNSSYTIASLQASNSGNYTIVIGNAAGSVSNTVPLAISAAPDTFTGFVNQGLVGVGRLPADSFDKLGANVDTLGGVFSGMYFDPASWVRTGTPGNYTYSGKLYGLPDRGFGDGAQDYHPRIEVLDISVTPYYGTGPVAQNQITISNSATLLLTDGTGAFFTGFDATDASVTNFPRSAVGSLGAGKRSLDPEGIHRMRDGSYFISDEYGASVYRFSAAGVLQATLPVPAALVPQNNGTNSYLAAVNPLSGRRPNRGFEGVSASPDERRLFVALQSPTIQDGGASNPSQHTRVLVYDIEPGSPNANQLIGEYVYQLTLRGDATFTRHTPLSEVVALNDHQLLVLERDGIGLGGTAGAPIYKSINLVELNGASNLLGTGYDLPLGAPGQLPLPLNGDSFAVTTNIFAATVKDFVNILDTNQLAKFGLNSSTNRDTNSITEKWEGVALIPMNEPGAPNDYLMLVGNDNDFKAPIVYHNGVSVGTNTTVVDNILFAYRVTLPGAQVSTTPTIATQPASGSANAGGSLTLSAGVAGAGPFTYQWFKNGTPVRGATNGTLQLNNLVGERGTNHLGPSTLVPPVMDSLLPGYAFQALFSAGETVNPKADGVTPYRMAGIPDGLGAFDNGNGTFTVLMNHELGNTVGTNRTHGGKGAFVSRWVIAKSNLAVLNISDLMTNVFLWNGTAHTQAVNAAFSRFCSADLPAPGAFYNPGTGLGTTNRIFMNGEESGKEGRALSHVVTGPDAGKSYELPYLGKIAWENSLASPFPQNKTIVMCNDDSGTTDSRVHVYIGTKSATGLDIDKAGLTGGTLYGIRLNGFTNESNAAVPPNGTAFSLFSFGNVSGLTGAQIEAQALANGVATFQRSEDGAWDPANPRDYYFVTTASFTGNSRLWRLRFADIANPENGGTIDLLVTGTEGHKMLDNLGFDADGNLLLQEDPGNQAYVARMWKYVPSTGAFFPVATFRPNLFTSGQPGFLTQDEESSGVIDVSSILGYKASLLVAQIHTTNGIPAGASTTEIVENGQLLLLRELDSGGYSLVVSNAFGAVTSAVANVTITAPPAIGDTAFRNGLPGATVGSGGTLNLSVPAGAVSGTGPFTYQWFLNGALITGATSSTLTVPGFNPAFAGNYTVQVGNASGSSTSIAVPVSTADIAFFGGVTIDGPANAKYRLEFLADVTNTNSWTTLTNVVHSGGRQFYIDTTSPGTQRRFFRAVPTP